MIGGSAVIGGMVASSSAQKTHVIPLSDEHSTGDFVGITYDPYTHKYQRPCRGNIAVSEDTKIEGEINLAGYSVLINDGETETKTETTVLEKYSDLIKYSTVSREETHIKRDKPLKLRLNHRGHCLSGIVTRPGHEFGRLAFTMCNKELTTVDALKDGLKKDRAVPGDRDLPNEGIPTPVDPAEVEKQ